MAEEIKIVASAVGFDQVDKALKSTATGMNEVSVAAKKTGDTLSKEMKNGSAQAAQSLSNLSRVAQDAPFGFVGISNNLSPLLESFQRLRAESGSTGGAIKTLVSSLSGPAGVGLALAAVTAAVTFAQMGFTAWTGSTKKSAEAVSEAKKELDSINSSIGKEAAQVNSLIAVLDNESESRNRKLEALKQLKNINPEIFGQLELENNKVANLTTAYDAYIKNLSAVVTAKILQGKLEKELTKLVELQGATLTATEKAAQDFGKTIQQGINNNLKALGGEAANAALQLEKVQSGFDKKKQNDIAITSAKIKELKDALSEVSKGIKLPEFKETKEKVKKVKEEIMKLTAFSPKKLELFSTDLGKMSAKERLAKFKQDLGVIEIPIMPVIDINGLPLPVKKGLIDLTTSLNSFMTEAAMSIGTGFADVLSTAIQGGNLGNAFAGIFASMAGLVEELGKQMIQIGITALIAKKALASVLANPYLAIAAGVALATLGSLIKSTVGQKSSFAVGTRNAPGGMALVGERGPELINLPRGSQVIPAAQTSNMMGAMQSIEVFGMLKGKDIYFSNKNYSKTYSTTT